MRILVTGASGFAGSHLVEALLKQENAEVYGTAYGKPDYLATLLPQDHIISVNLSERESVEQLIQQVQPDQVYHLASFAFVGQSFERGSELLANNILLQSHMLEAMHTHAPKARMLTIGSAEEYGLSEEYEVPIKEDHPLRPINPYAVSKVAQDLLAYAYAVSLHMDLVRVRPFNHIGERQSPDFAVPAFAKQIVGIEKGTQDTLFVGNLDAIRDFTDVKDMVQAYILLMEKGKNDEVYNIGSGVGVSMNDVVQNLISFSQKKIEIKTDESRLRPLDIPSIVADASKTRSLGWKQRIPLRESLKRVLEYWRKVNI